MTVKEDLLRKKNRRKKRFLRFVLVLVLIIVAVSLFLYAAENPTFLGGLRGRAAELYETSKIVIGMEEATGTTEAAEQGEEYQPGQAWEETAEEEIPARIDPAGAPAEKQEERSDTIWQKIIAYFKSRMEDDADKFPSRVEINVYFATLGQDYKFSSETRTIIAGNPETAVTNAVEELLKGPAKSFNYPVIPPGTKLLGAEVQRNFAKLDFSRHFLDNSLDSQVLDEYVIYTIVNTVTQVPGVEGVIFSIEGKRIKVYGNIDLSLPAISDEKYL